MKHAVEARGILSRMKPRKMDLGLFMLHDQPTPIRGSQYVRDYNRIQRALTLCHELQASTHTARPLRNIAGHRSEGLERMLWAWCAESRLSPTERRFLTAQEVERYRRAGRGYRQFLFKEPGKDRPQWGLSPLDDMELIEAQMKRVSRGEPSKLLREVSEPEKHRKREYVR